VCDESIKDIKVANSFSLALSEEGRLYSWGVGMNGHLGSGDTSTRIIPNEVAIDFKEEVKKLKGLKKKHRSMEEVEELLTLRSFVNHASKHNQKFS